MRPALQARNSTAEHLLFLPGVFNETLALLFDAHHYFQSRGADDHRTLDSYYQKAYTTEMSRITIRLTSVMAWLMVRRAVSAGKIDEEKASRDYRLDGGDICLAEPDAMIDMLPYYFWQLSERSQELYERVMRLDGMVYGTR